MRGRAAPLRDVTLALLVLSIFALSTLWVRDAIVKNAGLQLQLQQTQYERGRLLRLQLDEETGIRGYAATGSRIFLAPYTSARRQFDRAAATLGKDLIALGMVEKPLSRERAINEMWLNEFAKPVLSHARGPNRLQLQLTGKALVDLFRDNDRQLIAEIDRQSQLEQNRTSSLIWQILAASLGIALAIVAMVAGYGIAQGRLTKRLEESDIAYEREREVTDALQDAFLRRSLPAFSQATFDGAYLPASEEARVGGDWYDAYQLSENRVLISIGDVAGHGVEAAVVMTRVRQSIAAIGTFERDPAAVLAHANQTLLMQDSQMVTALCGFVDVRTGTIAYASAGHPPMLLFSPDGTVELLSTKGAPLGAADRPTYVSQLKRVVPGSLLVLYTDGLIEQERDTDKGERKLVEAVRRIDVATCLNPASQIVGSVLAGMEPRDDVAVLTMRFLGDYSGENNTLPDRPGVSASRSAVAASANG